MWRLLLALVLPSVAFASSYRPGPNAPADMSWIQAYNAAWVRVRASGVFKNTIGGVDPSILTDLPFIADCPATPGTYPFPPRLRGSRLDVILRSKKVVIAQQSLAFPAFEAAFATLGRAIVQEISNAYKVDLAVHVDSYPVSDAAVEAVVQGKADVTDPFYRQWTLTVDNQVQRSVQITPACTMWASFLSISWNGVRNTWNSLEDLRKAGSAVVIPLYSTILPFKADIRNALPDAKLLDRPQQNFEGDVKQLAVILDEFLDGTTTALLAAKGDIAGVLSRANLLRPFPLDDLKTVRTNVVLPVGAFLPAPGPRPSTRDATRATGGSCSINTQCKSFVCVAREDGKYGGRCT